MEEAIVVAFRQCGRLRSIDNVVGDGRNIFGLVGHWTERFERFDSGHNGSRDGICAFYNAVHGQQEKGTVVITEPF